MKPRQAIGPKLLPAFGLATACMSGTAAEPLAGPFVSQLPAEPPDMVAYAGRVAPPADAYTKKEAQTGEAAPRTWDHALPFFAQRVIDQGYDLPEPYSIGLSFYSGKQDLTIQNLHVAFNGGPMRDASFIGFDAKDMHNNTAQFQLGAWVFPFLNVFVIAGRVQGSGDIGITMSGRDLMSFLNVPGCELPDRLQPNLCKQNITGTAHADYHGSTLGGGFTLAGAHKQLFFSMPVTYVVNDVTISDTPTRAFTAMPRAGYIAGLGDYGQLTSYFGMDYMYTRNHLTGTFVFPTSDTVIGHDSSLSFDMEQRQVKAWNYLAGAHWAINRQWSVLAEIGFGETRQDLILAGFFRF